MVVTNDSQVAETVRKLRTHGWRKKYYPELLGYNSRLDELQAAVLQVKLRHLDAWNKRRREIAESYRVFLADCEIGLPWEEVGAKHVYHLYMIRVKDRTAVQQHLKSLGIASGIYYPLPLHQVEPYRHVRYASGAFDEAERAAQETLAIPLYPEMTEDQIKAVASGVREASAAT